MSVRVHIEPKYKKWLPTSDEVRRPISESLLGLEDVVPDLFDGRSVFIWVQTSLFEKLLLGLLVRCARWLTTRSDLKLLLIIFRRSRVLAGGVTTQLVAARVGLIAVLANEQALVRCGISGRGNSFNCNFEGSSFL